MAAQVQVDVAFTVVRPGDTLIVGLRRETLSRAEAEEYKAHLRERLPGVADVVVLAGVSALATYRPDDDAH